MNHYQVFYEQLSDEHPLWKNEKYRAFVEQRQEIGAQLQRIALPAGSLGFIIEVNTSAHWTLQRPQIVLGEVQERVLLRLKEGHSLTEGLGGLYPVREKAFVPFSYTAYADRELSIEAMPLGRSAWGRRAARRTLDRHDPMRYHQYRPRRAKTVRRELALVGDEEGTTFTTAGDLLSVALHTGEPVWPHMILRITVSQTYGKALALSYLGEKTAFFPDEMRNRVGVCYQLLFRPDATPC
jgi:hypothetical protein